ncbi:MAG: fumarate reductase/succinate dehydrogenase flavoprotein-like protein [Dehalococcoidia bacterium]|nr:fumarate reductase/succinate dehydrogenase flavoprotein-like protein [Dehalococcoidia bacterium]
MARARKSEPKADVAIVGAGMGGLIAAIEAAGKGARVTVLDKLGPMIGKGIKAHGFGWFGNETCRAGGGGLDHVEPEMPVEELLAMHLKQGWGRVDLELLRLFHERVLGDIRWLRDDLGLPFTSTGSLFGSILLQTVHVKGRGPGLMRFLYQAAEKRGIEIRFETKVLELLTGDLGEVIGLRARDAGGTRDIHAGAVVLAAGGFEGNNEMMLRYVGPQITYGAVISGCPTNTGDGHQMALEAGAQLTNMSVCHINTTNRLLSEGPTRRLRNIWPGGIYVNKEGQRFIDEGTADSDTLSNAIAYQPGSVAALIFDERARLMDPEAYAAYPYKDKLIRSAATIEELAETIEMPPAQLRRIVNEFNASVEGKAHRLETPPYYAYYPVVPGLNHTLGGVKINTAAQVIDRENRPIAGLYAAGSMVNWSFGKPFTVAGVTSYMGNYHIRSSKKGGALGGLSTALVFGRIAGERAAQAAIKKPKLRKS